MTFTFSGTDNFNLTRNQIVTRAYQLINCYSPECDGPLDNNMLAFGTDVLNMMVKHWQAQGLHLWTTQEGILFLAQGQIQYDLSLSSPDRFLPVTGVVSTYLTANAAASATSLTVNSATGLSNGMNIGICLDTGIIQWTTITNIVGTTITINNALTSQASSTENVYAYASASILDRPLRVLSCRVVTQNLISVSPPSSTEIKMVRMSRDEYYNIPNKLTQTQPTSYYYDPQLNTGLFNIWPAPYQSTQYLRLTYEQQVEDFDNPTDYAYFPQEWVMALTYNLAIYLAPGLGKTQEDIALLQAQATQLLQDVKNYDVELNSVYMMPSTYRNT